MRHLVNTLLTLLTGALLLGSCREKPQIQEEISVNPTTIEAKVALASYKIAVQSNAAWTVAVEGTGQVRSDKCIIPCRRDPIKCAIVFLDVVLSR